jgi:hypothetical protein
VASTEVTYDERATELIGEAVLTAVRRAVEDIGPVPAPVPEPEPEVIDLTEHSWARQLLALDVADPEAADPYAVFGLPRTASWDEILLTRKRLARAWHPDAGGDEASLRSLNAAFAELRIRRGR